MGLELDGASFSPNWQVIENTSVHFARVRLDDGPHALRADTDIGIEVHGYDCNVSYAFAGGLDLHPTIE